MTGQDREAGYRLSFPLVMVGVLWMAGFLARTRDHPLEPATYNGLWALIIVGCAAAILGFLRLGRLEHRFIAVVLAFGVVVAFQFALGAIHKDAAAVERGGQVALAAGAWGLGWLAGRELGPGSGWLLRWMYVVVLAGAAAFFGATYLLQVDLFNPNLAGYLPMYALTLGYLGAETRRHRRFVTLSGVIPILLAALYQARAGVVVGLALIAVVYAGPWLSRSRWRFALPVAGVGVAIPVVVGIAVHGAASNVRIFLESASISMLGRRFFTGRDELWTTGVGAITERPWLGWGPSAEMADFMATTLSMHNYYLQVALEGGSIGLLLIVMLFASMAWYLVSNRGTSGALVGMALLSAVLFHQIFSVSLTQTTLAAAIPAWVLLGLCTGSAVWGTTARDERGNGGRHSVSDIGAQQMPER